MMSSALYFPRDIPQFPGDQSHRFRAGRPLRMRSQVIGHDKKIMQHFVFGGGGWAMPAATGKPGTVKLNNVITHFLNTPSLLNTSFSKGVGNVFHKKVPKHSVQKWKSFSNEHN